jgi:mono/diheme cytochrome c family protein
LLLIAGGHYNRGAFPSRASIVVQDRSMPNQYRMALVAAAVMCSPIGAAEPDGAARFRATVEPILAEYCIGCHGSGLNKGGVAFDQFGPGTAPQDDRTLWWKALKMVRAGLMPPKSKPRPTADEIVRIEHWIKESAFKIDPKDPDPGRVTVRRLNRVEYRNTIRDLLGVQYDTDAAFPPDDTGHGFDNIGEVLTLSPLLLEKYIAAARAVVAQAVPTSSAVVAEQRLPGRRFRAAGEAPAAEAGDGPLPLSYYKPATVTAAARAAHAGRYQVAVDLTANETYVEGVFDYNKCRLVFKVDGQPRLTQEYTRQGGRPFHYDLDAQDWAAGEHELAFELQPLTPNERQVRSLTLRVVAVTVRGPLAREHWVLPPTYPRFFPRPVPESLADRRQYARDLLTAFATKAFRRPVDAETEDRLAKFAEGVYTRPGQTLEAGVAQAMTVVLASPRFLFREEGVLPGRPGAHPLVNEYALASRLSYFLWSSMPDDELFRLAGANKLRENLGAQVARMLADPRSAELVRHFTGQWLQARDIETVEVNARAIVARDAAPDPMAQQRQARFRELNRKPPASLTDAEKKELAEARAAFFGSFRRFAQFDLTGDLRRAMRRETEMVFEHVLRNDRSLLELLDSDYTFLNERLARHYAIEGVKGDQMRLVKLPPNSPRGGVLTQGTVLATTSNPDRTSPVKRGLFILDNILGTPPPPPPPDIPALEDATTKSGGKPATLREALALHRSQALCSSCHNRMDPLGLALEHFNALGRWRDKERDHPIDAAGQLITGESFTTVQELKRILVTDRRRDFYRCLTEKMLTYALGRGLDYYDVQAVDEIVSRIEKAEGRPSALVMGVIESAPFQKRRAPETSAAEPGKTDAKTP